MAPGSHIPVTPPVLLKCQPEKAQRCRPTPCTAPSLFMELLLRRADDWVLHPPWGCVSPTTQKRLWGAELTWNHQDRWDPGPMSVQDKPGCSGLMAPPGAARPDPSPPTPHPTRPYHPPCTRRPSLPQPTRPTPPPPVSSEWSSLSPRLSKQLNKVCFHH